MHIQLRGFAKKRFRSRAGFSALELLVVIGILVILLSIFIPYVLKLREDDSRFRCSNNLRQLFIALNQYAHMNNGDYPRVVYDAVNNPNGYTCFTGPDGDPFSKNSAIKPNDVTASLWLLVRLKLADPTYFICPSTSDSVDTADDSERRSIDRSPRGNFRGPQNLSYSYASPFGAAPGYRLNDTRRADFALMADKNPGAYSDQSNATFPPVDAPPLKMSLANSLNHANSGQNVLYSDSHVAFQSTPYCGVSDENRPTLHDNIYTALAPRPLEKGQYIPKYANGLIRPDVGPAWEFDSYLIPTATDQPPIPAISIATQPTTEPAPKPTSTPATVRSPAAPATTQAATRASAPPTTIQSIPTTTPTTGPSTRP